MYISEIAPSLPPQSGTGPSALKEPRFDAVFSAVNVTAALLLYRDKYELLSGIQEV